MADVQFRLNTTEKDARWLKGGALADSVKIDPLLVKAAVDKAMQPGLAALRRNVGQMGVKTGRLKRSPAILTKRYGGSRRLTVVGLVGYRSGVAPHATFVELGTKPRAGRGIMPKFYLAWSAFFSNRNAMQATMRTELENIVADAIRNVS